jgi:hypothetical protein
MLLLRRLSRFIQHLYLRQYLLVHYLCGGVATNAVTMPRSQGESQSQATGMRMCAQCAQYPLSDHLRALRAHTNLGKCMIVFRLGEHKERQLVPQFLDLFLILLFATVQRVSKS